jgi:hypothetical protein
MHNAHSDGKRTMELNILYPVFKIQFGIESLFMIMSLLSRKDVLIAEFIPKICYTKCIA